MLISKDTPLKTILKIASECTKCGHCCKHGSGFLIKEDMKKIADFLEITPQQLEAEHLEEFEKFNTKAFRPKLLRKQSMPFGQCVFLNNNECAIQPVKPFGCKVTSVRSVNGDDLRIWADLNFFVNKDDPQSIRDYAFYLKHAKTIPGGELENLVPKEKLKKILNYEIM